MVLKFENLSVWKKSLELGFEIHELTRSFPKEELYILISQIKRAADSVTLNIAEGSIGQSDKEFNRFLGIALRGAVEVISCLHIAKRRGLVNQGQFEDLYNKFLENIKMIQSFRKTLKQSIK